MYKCGFLSPEEIKTLSNKDLIRQLHKCEALPDNIREEMQQELQRRRSEANSCPI